MSLEENIERQLAELAFGERIIGALVLGRDQIDFKDDEAISRQEKEVEKYRSDGLVITAEYAKESGKMTLSLVQESGGKRTGLAEFNSHSWALSIDRVAISPGRTRVAFEYNEHDDEKLKSRKLYVVYLRGKKLEEVEVPNPEITEIAEEDTIKVTRKFSYYGKGALLAPEWKDEDTLEVIWQGYKKTVSNWNKPIYDFEEEKISLPNLSFFGLERTKEPDFPRTSIFKSPKIIRYEPTVLHGTDYTVPVSDPCYCLISFNKDNKVKRHEFRRVAR